MKKMQAMKPPTFDRHDAMRALFVAVGGLCVVWGVQAQQSVYRCGQEYTNAPRDKSRCQLLQAQAVTVIEGTRPSMGGSGSAPAEERTKTELFKTEPSKTETSTQKDRDAQARTIVASELEKTQQQHAQMLREYKQGATVQGASESREQVKHQERMAILKAAIDRAERDMESLQRELARRPPAPAHP